MDGISGAYALLQLMAAAYDTCKFLRSLHDAPSELLESADSQPATAKFGKSPGLRSSTHFLCAFTQSAAHQQRNESLRKQVRGPGKASGRVHNLLELPKPHAKEIGGHETFYGEGSDSEIPDSAQRVHVESADRSHDQFKQS